MGLGRGRSEFLLTASALDPEVALPSDKAWPGAVTGALLFRRETEGKAGSARRATIERRSSVRFQNAIWLEDVIFRRRLIIGT
ncbi:hypothetical protein NDU88_003382 [Pleurodeles waltl]|uniref:Uncharacterized protein n=1 Tax=Pleurodeles waltl TaxID=8319 RepID=A0AAV7W614_PLEWA|nr:hypothetical protein NDU88_003382 [Pleurodeles waltl]